MNNERRVLVYPDRADLCSTLAARLIRKLVELIERQGEVTVVLTGGNMGIAILAAVNVSPDRNAVDWMRVNFWWGDERWVPRADADRNERQAREVLLDHLALDSARVHPFPASDEGVELDEAAAIYAAELAANSSSDSPIPHIDITFLGVGPDGHIASLFPNRGGIGELAHTVVAVRNSPKPPPERLSLTLPVINSSDRVWLVLAGADKASALGLALAGASPIEVPAAGAQGRRRTLFFVDHEAAAEVPENLTSPGQYWTGDDE